jgi:hypothetical protein
MNNSADAYKRKFQAQRARAKHRGIEWHLTFEQWLEVWEKSGKLGQRGKGVGKYVMSRNGDAGPYSMENVSIQSYEKNCADVNVNHADRCWGPKHCGKGRGSYRVVRGSRVTYLSRFRGKYLGVFDTAQEAEAAYQRAATEYQLTKTS